VTSAELKRAKREVRRRVLAVRDALPPERREELAARVTERFLALPEVEAASVVMAFWSVGSELSTRPLIDALLAQGCVVALPRIVAGALEPRTWRPGDPLSGTPFGAMEPEAGTVVDPAAIDVVATPAVAFDRTGGRVGYGGGFYDRFFPRTRADAARIGIGFGLQLVDEDLPGAGFDLRVGVVVTESETVRCGVDP
jgi:5-formyltetrahydrofolate cyclo-ligase